MRPSDPGGDFSGLELPGVSPRQAAGYAESQLTPNVNLSHYSKYPGLGYATPDQYKNYILYQAHKQDLYDKLLKNLVDRSSTYPTAFVEDAPSTFGGILTAPLDNYAVKLIGQGLQTGYPWLKAVTGGGDFAAAYGAALQLQDPEARAAALGVIDGALKDLGRGYGDMSAASIGTPGRVLNEFEQAQQTAANAGATTEQLDMLRTNPSFAVRVFAGAGIQLNFDPAGNVISADVETKDTGLDAQGNIAKNPSGGAKDFMWKIALLQYLFPNAKLNNAPEGIEKVSYAGEIVTQGIGKGFDHIFKPVGDILGAGAEAVGPVGHSVKHFVGSGIRGFAPIVGGIGDILKAPYSLGVAAGTDLPYLFDKALGKNPENDVTHPHFINPLKVVIPWAYGETPGTGLGLAVNNALNITPGSPAYEKNLAVSNFIESWAGIKALGEGAAAVKAAGIEPLSALTGGRFFAPKIATGEFAGPIYARIIHDFMSKGPDEFISTAGGRRLINDFLRIDKDSPGAGAGKLLAQYPKMPPDMARAVGEAGPTFAEKANAWLDYMKNDKPANVPGLLAEREATQRQLSALDEMDTHPPAATVQPEGLEQLRSLTERWPQGEPGIEVKTFPGVAADLIYRDDAGVARGTLHVGLTEEGLPEGPAIWVDPASRGQGIAKQLVQKATSEFDFSRLDLGSLELTDQGAGLLQALARDPLAKANLQVRLAEINRDLALGDERAPIFDYLKPSAWRRVAVNMGKNPAERMLSYLYDPPVRFAPHLSRIFDTMGHTKIYNWFRDDAPADAKAKNAELIGTYFKRAGVPQEAINAALRKMTRVSNDAEFYDWLLDVQDLWDHARHVYESFKPKLKRINDRGDEGAHRSQLQTRINVDGNAVGGSLDVLTRPVVDEFGETTWRGLPSMDAELIDHVWLPSVERLIDSSSATRQFIRTRYAKGGSSRLLADAVRGLKATSGFATAVLKPLILTSRVPALILRTQLEQIARTEANGFHLLNPFRFGLDDSGIPRIYSRFAEVLPADLQSLGLLFDPFADVLESPGKRNFVMVDTYDTVAGGKRLLREEGAQAIHWNMTKIFKSPTIRELVESWDVDSWVTWLEGDSKAASLARSRFDPILKQDRYAVDNPDASLTELRKRWGERMKESIDQLTGGRQDLRLALLTGKWRINDLANAVLENKLTPEESSLYRSSVLQAGEWETKIRELRLNGADSETLRAARSQKLEARNTVRRLEKKADLNKSAEARLAHREEFMAALRQEVEAGKLTPPAKLGGYDYNSMSNTEAAATARNWVQTNIYEKGMPVIRYIPGVRHLFELKSATKVDALFTRGSLFYQAQDRAFTILKQRGFSDAEARVYADAEGARVTSDLMYDLSARTSAQRFLRNQSYFLPAYQELLTTWLVKIPSRSYWPVGAFLYADRAHLLVQMLKDTGIIQKDSNGNDIVPIPGMSEFLSKAGAIPGLHFLETLKPDQVKDMISFNAKSVNLVLQGWPSISTQYSLPLNWAAKHSEAMAALANQIEPFGTETTLAPSALTYFYEAVTGKSPPWEVFSPEHQAQTHDLAFDDAMKQAIAELQNDGVKAPDSTKYADTPYGTNNYLNATKEYRDEVMKRANSVYRGWAFVRTLGSTIGPAAFHVTDSYKSAASKVLETLYGKEPKDRDSSAYQQWLALRKETIDTFLADHPGSIAYMVGRTQLTGDSLRSVTLPYTQGREDQFWNQLYAGQRAVLSPKDYLTRVMAYESYRQYVGQRDEAMGRIGATAPELLKEGKIRADVLSDYHLKWERYLWLMDQGGYPVRSMIAAQQRLWDKAQSPDQIPQDTFETEWLSNAVTAVNDLANTTAVGGVRDQDITHTLSAFKKSLALALEAKGATPFSAAAKGIAWYGQNVMVPYINQVQPLYEKARQIRAAGGNPSDIYNQIRDIANRYSTSVKGPDKLSYPGVEEVFWGKLTDDEKEAQRLSWISKPVTWLTGFQAKTAGFSLPPGWDKFSHKAAEIDAEVQSYIDAQHGEGSTKRIDHAEKVRDQAISQQAQKFGVGNLWQLSQEPPAGRFLFTNTASSKVFALVYQFAQQTSARARRHGLSEHGFADEARIGKDKAALFSLIDQLADQYPEFNTELDDIGHSMQSQGREFLAGPLLYNALFFGGFDPRSIPPEVVQAHLEYIGS